MLSKLPRKGRLVGAGYDIDVDGYSDKMLPGVRVEATVSEGMWTGPLAGVLLGFSKDRTAHIRAAPRTFLICCDEKRDFSGWVVSVPVSCITRVIDSFGAAANTETEWDSVDVSLMELPNE